MQPCFSFLNLRLQAQFYAGLILSTREMSTQFWLDLLTRGIFFKRLLNFFSESQCGSCLFCNSLLLFGSWGTSVHLPVLYSHIKSMGKLIIFFCTLPTRCPGLGLLYSATAESHCRATAPAVTPAPPAEGMRASVGKYTLGQSMRETSALFFYKGILGCSFFCLRPAPHSGRGERPEQHMCCRPVYFLLAFFSGDAQGFYY